MKGIRLRKKVKREKYGKMERNREEKKAEEGK